MVERKGYKHLVDMEGEGSKMEGRGDGKGKGAEEGRGREERVKHRGPSEYKRGYEAILIQIQTGWIEAQMDSYASPAELQHEVCTITRRLRCLLI